MLAKRPKKSQKVFQLYFEKEPGEKCEAKINFIKNKETLFVIKGLNAF